MAQALFDEHPLEIYLRNAGEEPEFIPGSSPELELELDPTRFTLDDDEDEETEWRPLFLIKICEALLAIISALDLSSHPNLFVERFKYDVISSSLLAVSLPSTHGRSPRPSLPGQLSHSRASSVEAQLNTPTPLPTTTSDPSYLIPSLAFGFSVVFFNAGYTFLAIASLGATVHIFKTMHDTSKHDMSPSLESLNDLIASSNEWEAVVQAAISTLETDERNLTTYGTTTPASPSSSIRIALQSSLLTTQTQCDNVRHLFSALTCPSELSQLSEMYAPPSPMNPNFLPFDPSQRPLSLPVRKRHSSLPSENPFPSGNKRSTWNGSYTQLAQVGAGSSSPVFRRREKRRSDLSSLLQVSDPRGLLSPKALSAPVTPIPISPAQSLPGVIEEVDGDHDEFSGIQSAGTLRTFGSAALDLSRSRKSAGMEAFRMPPPSYFSTVASPTPHTPRTPASSTLSPGSKFTPIQTTRHLLSISALHHALQGALASKRYACSHLLALRFSDEEDEGYWEDVRSVMGLLTTTLADAASRLNVAMEIVEQQKLRDQNPTPCLRSEFPVSEQSDDEDQDATFVDAEEGEEPNQKPVSKQLEEVSFAPMPSHVTRFATHVEAITAALDDARENLADCVAALREERAHAVSPKRRSRSRRSMQVPEDGVPNSRALEAYERLRRELGLALRECERGRERLLDIVFPPNLQEDTDSEEDLPGLGHDASDDSDKVDSAFPFDDDNEQEGVGGYTMVAVDGAEALDDVTSHLLLTASTQHLPAPGIEQVYEADSGNVGIFTRERSKLTREERIQLVKARRESGGSTLGVGVDISSSLPLGKEKYSGVEMWGPGGDVVQELKDVIWKVGERRRKMLEGPLDSVVPSEARPDLVSS